MKSIFVVIILALTCSTLAFAEEVDNSKKQLIDMRTQGSYHHEPSFVQERELSPKMNAVDDYQLVLRRIEHKSIMKGR